MAKPKEPPPSRRIEKLLVRRDEAREKIERQHAAGTALALGRSVREHTDLLERYPPACLPFNTRLTMGTLHLSTFDFPVLTSVHGILEAEVEGGHWVWITF
jgi:hypothetical protein